jgi:hypothetical protein
MIQQELMILILTILVNQHCIMMAVSWIIILVRILLYGPQLLIRILRHGSPIGIRYMPSACLRDPSSSIEIDI